VSGDVDEAWFRREQLDFDALFRAHHAEIVRYLAARLGSREEAADVASDMRRRALDVAGPSRDKIFRHVYSEPHPLMAEESAWLEAYESGFEGGAA